ncbi:hypothetical protein PMAYCL1PPCAC_10164, partial [Pristionchus mayeri]
WNITRLGSRLLHRGGGAEIKGITATVKKSGRSLLLRGRGQLGSGRDSGAVQRGVLRVEQLMESIEDRVLLRQRRLRPSALLLGGDESCVARVRVLDLADHSGDLLLRVDRRVLRREHADVVVL